MTTSVNVTETPVQDYTWTGAAFAWNSITAEDRTWATAYEIDYAVDVGETCLIGEAITKDASKSVSESVIVAEQGVRATAKFFAETFAFQETYTDIIGFILGISESFAIAETPSKGVTKAPFSESFSVADVLVKAANLGINESVLVSEAFERAVQFHLGLMEALGIAEVLSNHPSLAPFEESFGITDAISKRPRKNVAESLTVADLWARTVTFGILVTEGLSVTDAISKAAELPFAETFQLFEEYRRKANGVISDMQIESGVDLDDNAFVTLLRYGSIPGYANFRPFLPGDYEYQYALYKAIFTSSDNDKPQITKLVAEVDVPDIFDRGTASVAVGGTAILFNRPFNVPPEVVASLKGGTIVATPKVYDITETGFSVKLELADGSTVSGTISWSAHGY